MGTRPLEITLKTINMVSLNKHEKGNMGEEIACKYLINKGFAILDRNYRKLWGELDIVGLKDGVIHFFEVKSVTSSLEERVKDLNDRFSDHDAYRPEVNVHGFKIRQIRRMVSTYMSERKINPETEFRFHVASVFMDMNMRRARVRLISDLIL